MKEYYKKENFEKIVAESYSIAEVIRKIGLVDKGSTFQTIKKYISLYELDITHFRGQNWNKGMSGSDYTAIVKLSDILKENVKYSNSRLKDKLIYEGLKTYKCEKCGCDGEWQGEPITLELHHINGNHYDNRIENLQILCPNCHSQTKTFRRRNEISYKEIKHFEKKKHLHVCKHCGKEFESDRKNKSFCSIECYHLYRKLLKA